MKSGTSNLYWNCIIYINWNSPSIYWKKKCQMILSTVKSSNEVVQESRQSYRIWLTATHISCWPLSFFGTIQRKCANYHQNKLFKTEYQFNPDASLLHCWYEDMIVYFETRKVDDLNLVDKDSTWINCYDWMRKYQKYFPGKSIKTIKWRSIIITKGKHSEVT